MVCGAIGPAASLRKAGPRVAEIAIGDGAGLNMRPQAKRLVLSIELAARLKVHHRSLTRANGEPSACDRFRKQTMTMTPTEINPSLNPRADLQPGTLIFHRRHDSMEDVLRQLAVQPRRVFRHHRSARGCGARWHSVLPSGAKTVCLSCAHPQCTPDALPRWCMLSSRY